MERKHVLKRVFTEANFSSAVFGERQNPPEGNSEQKPNLSASMLHLKESTSTHWLQALSTQLNFMPPYITSGFLLKIGAD